MKKDVEQLVCDVIKSRKQANKLQKVIEYISAYNDASVVISASEGAVKIFNHFMKNEEISFRSKDSELSSVEQFKCWIGDRFADCYKAVLKCLFDIGKEKQSLLMSNCMELLKIKATVLNSLGSDKRIYLFPEEDLRELIKTALLCSNEEILHLIVSYVKFDDFRCFVLKSIFVLLSNKSFSGDAVLFNIFSMLEAIAKYMPSDTFDVRCSFVFEEDALSDYIQNNCKENPFMINMQRKMFGKAWLEFLKQPLSGTLHKKILIILHNTLIPNFAKPRLLSDFLIRSFSMGGGLALLGLHGIFVLINEHNLEYPDFYKNLYSMLHPRTFDAKYKSRFFNLLPIFLSSTHISAYLIAAFIKKMSRLCLCAPPNEILIMLGMIKNLLFQHPNVRHIMHQPFTEKPVDLDNDPYLDSELDPAKCNAMESSLWEVRALLSHYSPDVARAADIKSLDPQMLCDTDELLELNYSDMIKFDENSFCSNAMSYVCPVQLVSPNEDLTSEMWHM